MYPANSVFGPDKGGMEPGNGQFLQAYKILGTASDRGALVPDWKHTARQFAGTAI